MGRLEITKTAAYMQTRIRSKDTEIPSTTSEPRMPEIEALHTGCKLSFVCLFIKKNLYRKLHMQTLQTRRIESYRRQTSGRHDATESYKDPTEQQDATEL